MAWSNIGGGGEDVTAEVQVQTPLVDQIMTALIGKVGDDANATAETILEGYKAWVQGEKIVGTYKVNESIGIIEKYFGCTEIAAVTFTFAQDSPANDNAINHSLGKTPKLAFIYSNSPDSELMPQTSNQYVKYGMIDNVNGENVYISFSLGLSYYATYKVDADSDVSNTTSKQPTASVVYLNTSHNYRAGVEYTIVTMA